MPVLREWVTVLTVDDEEGSPDRVPIFSCLTDLSLKECPQLRPELCLPASVEKLIISRTSKENLSLILERATPLDGGDATNSLQPPPNMGLRDLTIDECQQLTCLPESLRSLTSLRSLNIRSCKDLERIEDWLGELTELESLYICGCSSLRYLPAHKMTALQKLHIRECPLLFDADGQFVDTTVDHIKNVKVNWRLYPYEELASSSSKEESSPKLLRYLDLSSTNIQELPKSITSHCNLQKLNLSGCCKIRTLPKFLGRLTNLRTLDLSRCSSLTILDSVSNLQNLCSLNLGCCEKVRSLEPICHLKNLYYLDLSSLSSLVTLPESIGRLQNLRILNLSKCFSLESLPSSSSDLQHLEKLDISGCGKLCELPKMIQKLTKLGVLLNNNCSKLKGMPRGIGKLLSLQELSVFVVGKQDRVEHCASISELEHLKLVGELEIKGLENVTSPVDAKAANLIEKNLRSLKLVWNVLSAEESMDSTVLPAEEIETVLENLQPHQKLKNLKIEGYGGGKFPSWMMNKIGSCLPNLFQIKLENIPGCSAFPPLGQLPFLEQLTIENMPAITNLGVDKFPALTRLELSSMPVLREWVTVLTVDDEEGSPERVPIFPCLTDLLLKECPQLRPEPCLPPSVEDLTISGTSSENLSLILKRATPLDGGDAAVSLQPPPNKGLRYLTLEKCQQLTCLPESLRSLTSLRRLTIDDCEDLERIEDWPGELTDLQSLHITKCSSLRYLPAHKMTALKQLRIKECPQLRPEPCLPVSVVDLTISRTSSENLSLILERATPLDGGDAAVSLQPPPDKGLRELTIYECQQFTCLPESLRGLTSLKGLTIVDCKDLERIEDWLGELTELRSLYINGCSSLRYLPAHKMAALQKLSISDCPLLFDAARQFVGTSVDHIKKVNVNWREYKYKYKYKKQVSNSPEEEMNSSKEEKKSWTNRWRRA